MAMKDYYAILMVHPQAEPFLIEAAYKRLAREYHPDLGPSPLKHEKMVEINEAFAVLSHPTRRKSYDREYAQQAFAPAAKTTTKQRATPRAQPSAPQKAADPLRGNISPVPPDSVAFGIDAGYLERARAGAQAWKRREHRIPKRVKWLTRALGAVVGLTLSALLFPWGVMQLAAFAWFVLPFLGELVLRAIEGLRDAHLLRYKYNPLYNPNPTGYQAYAAASAQYQAESMIVYVTRDGIFHAQKTCQALTSYDSMPKWFARLRNARPCPRCAPALTVAPQHLPPPFGNGAG